MTTGQVHSGGIKKVKQKNNENNFGKKISSFKEPESASSPYRLDIAMVIKKRGKKNELKFSFLAKDYRVLEGTMGNGGV